MVEVYPPPPPPPPPDGELQRQPLPPPPTRNKSTLMELENTKVPEVKNFILHCTPLTSLLSSITSQLPL